MKAAQELIGPHAFNEWKVFHECYEPFGGEWQQTAKLIAAVINAMGGKAKWEQFMPTRRPRMTRRQREAADRRSQQELS